MARNNPPKPTAEMVAPSLGIAPVKGKRPPLLNPLLTYPVDMPTSAPVPQTTTEVTTTPDVMWFPLDDLGPNPYNSRAIYNDADIELIRVSLLEHGQLEAVRIRKNPDPAGPPYLLVNGQTRWLAAKASMGQITKLWAVITQEQNPQKLFEESFAANSDRQKNSDLDKALSWAKMLKEGIYESQAELAARLKIHVSTVSLYIRIAELPLDLITQLKRYHQLISITHAFEIAKAYEQLGADAATDLITTLVQGQEDNRMSVRELQRQVKRLLTRKVVKPVVVRTLPPLKLTVPTGEVAGELATNRAGELKLKLKLKDPSEQNQLALDIRALLSKYGLK